MAPDNNNWLSFSVSSVELLNAASSQTPMMHSSTHDSQHFYSFADNFYANVWPDPKQQGVYPETVGNVELKDHGGGTGSSSIFDGYMQPPPKLEDFFAGGDSTETQDSPLTHLYDPAHHRPAFFSAAAATNHQELKDFTGFQAFSATSGDAVVLASPTQSPVESGTDLVPYSRCHVPPETPPNNLTLAVNNNNTTNNTNTPRAGDNNDGTAIVPVDSDNFKKIADTFGQRTSIYRGVTRHRWTGRYEAHLWDNSCRREGQARKGRQVYLGGYDKEEKAARAYDLAALKYWGPTATTNFPISNYSREVEEMKHVTRQEFIASLRRKSSGFSRGASIYRGVTRHHQQGRWQARIGRVAGNKDLYLGTFATEEEAAEAYDIAAIKFRGVNAVTNFEMTRYDVEAIAKSPLPIGETAKRLRLALESESKLPQACSRASSNISFSAIQPTSTIPCAVPLIAAAPFLHQNLVHHIHTGNYGVEDPAMVTPVSMIPSPPEFYIWPHRSQ